MANVNIVELGRATRFSSTNQPENRGTPKGRRNRKTIINAILSLTDKEWIFYTKTGVLPQ
jgi:hypothetical protein